MRARNNSPDYATHQEFDQKRRCYDGVCRVDVHKFVAGGVPVNTLIEFYLVELMRADIWR